MQTQNRLIGDLTRMAGGALGLVAGLRGEIDALVRQRLQRLLGEMALVSREEFDAVKAMAAKARAEQEDLAERLARLEADRAPRRRRSAAKRKPAAPPEKAESEPAPEAAADKPGEPTTD